MRSRFSKTTKFVLASAVGVAFCAATASADIVTFWKTTTCPNFGGAKFAIASEVGRMEAPADFEAFQGIGGPFCVLDSTPRVSTPGVGKVFKIPNAQIWVNEFDQGGNLHENWRCVVCQYQEKVSSLPAVSLLGTVVLMAGLLTAGAYKFGKKRQREEVAYG